MEAKVFEKAVSELCDNFWRDHNLDGFSVTAEGIPCVPNENHESFYSDYEVQKLLNRPIQISKQIIFKKYEKSKILLAKMELKTFF